MDSVKYGVIKKSRERERTEAERLEREKCLTWLCY